MTDRFITRAYSVLLSADLLLWHSWHRWAKTGSRSPLSSSVPEAEKWVHWSTALETINSEEMQEHSATAGFDKYNEHFIKVCTGNKSWEYENWRETQKDILKWWEGKEYKRNNFERWKRHESQGRLLFWDKIKRTNRKVEIDRGTALKS